MKTQSFSAFMLGLALVGVSGCDGGQKTADIPMQRYGNPLQTWGMQQGSVEGRVLFPRQAVQHSVQFRLGKHVFVTLSDGRFYVRSVPVGKHMIIIQAAGYRAVTQSIIVLSKKTTTLQTVHLQPLWKPKNVQISPLSFSMHAANKNQTPSFPRRQIPPF